MFKSPWHPTKPIKVVHSIDIDINLITYFRKKLWFQSGEKTMEVLQVLGLKAFFLT